MTRASRRQRGEGVVMEVIHERCAGLDVHKETVVGCVRVSERGEVHHEVRRFATTTAGLLQLADWLRQIGCTHVALEATGVYWKPVWHILEGEFELILANPAHIRNVPGRKSDVDDATWIADLLAHGLIRSRMVPPGSDPGAARSDPHPQAVDVRGGATQAAYPESARGRQCEVGFGSGEHVWPERAADAQGDHCRTKQCPQAGSFGQRATVRVARNPGPGAARQGPRPSSILAQATPADDRPLGADRRRVRGPDRGCAGALSGRSRTPDDDSGRQRDSVSDYRRVRSR